MSTFSDEMAAVGLELLTEFGEAVSFSRAGAGTYNTSTGAITGAGADTAYTGYAVPVDYDNSEISGQLTGRGELINRGDVKLFVNATTTVPLPADKVTLDSVEYRVMDVRKYAINSENVLYELQIRI